MSLQNAARRLDTVHDRHLDIHQHNVNRVVGNELDGLGPVAAGPHAVHVARSRDELRDGSLHERVVVHDQEADQSPSHDLAFLVPAGRR